MDLIHFLWNIRFLCSNTWVYTNYLVNLVWGTTAENVKLVFPATLDLKYTKNPNIEQKSVQQQCISAKQMYRFWGNIYTCGLLDNIIKGNFFPPEIGDI